MSRVSVSQTPSRTLISLLPVVTMHGCMVGQAGNSQTPSTNIPSQEMAQGKQTPSRDTIQVKLSTITLYRVHSSPMQYSYPLYQHSHHQWCIGMITLLIHNHVLDSFNLVHGLANLMRAHTVTVGKPYYTRREQLSTTCNTEWSNQSVISLTGMQAISSTSLLLITISYPYSCVAKYTITPPLSCCDGRASRIKSNVNCGRSLAYV